MLCFPNAKINIGLNVISKRSDGYHNIETIFCPIDLSDILEFVLLPGVPAGHYAFTSTGIGIEGPVGNNLCIKAYLLLSRDFDLPAVDIHLHKIIPIGAGIGGGSSDAAFMLKSLNQQFGLNLDDTRLCDYASVLGSDCTFFIKNRPLLGYEKGNRFKEVPLFPESLEIVLVNPGIHISTSEAYSGILPGRPLRPLEELIMLPIEQWRDNIINDFESNIITKYPVIGEIKAKLYAQGAIYVSMSGSGSSVYGLFSGRAPGMVQQYPDFFCWSGPLAIKNS